MLDWFYYPKLPPKFILKLLFADDCSLIRSAKGSSDLITPNPLPPPILLVEKVILPNPELLLLLLLTLKSPTLVEKPVLKAYFVLIGWV